MNFCWGDDLIDTTPGLDILGVRGIDQAVELALVNGLTTISQRGRFLSILPWALGEFLITHASDGFDWDRLIIYLRRVEFVTLVATRLDSDNNGGDASGALGADLHQDQVKKLLDGEPVNFPDDKGGAILGTYLGPCRALGLLVDGDDVVPYRLTPRGKEIWQARNKRLKGSSVVAAISIGTQFTRALAKAAIPDFSLGALAQPGEEASLLHDSLVTTWDPGDEAGRAAVTAAYNGLNGTIAWTKGMLADKPDNAIGLLVRNYQTCIDGKTADRISLAWAEYEYRRRCHYALELLLAALTNQLGELSEASIRHVVTEWSEVGSLSPTLAKIWPRAAMAWKAPAVDVAASVPEDLFIDKALPTGDLRRLAAADQALAAFAILTATARQTKRLRQEGHLDRKPESPGERALAIVEAADREPFSNLLGKLVELTALAHLQTTLRKMGAGQKCSLRFFPDGPLLRPTGIGVLPGHSNDRLTNVLRILADVDELRRDGSRFTPSNGAPR